MDISAVHLLDLVGSDFILIIPRLIAQEVTRNLETPEQVRHFYRLFHRRDFAYIIEEPVPSSLVKHYIDRGLRAKADAFIGAFAEWMQVHYLISDNRHFLRDLNTTTFSVTNAQTFVNRWKAGIV